MELVPAADGGASPTPSPTVAVKVVILGCGIAGAMVAAELEKRIPKLNHPIHLTVIDRHDVVWFKISAIRATVDSRWIDRTQIPIAEVVKNGTFVHGTVKAVDKGAKVVKVATADGRNVVVNYDVLLCASGALSASPSDLPPWVITSTQTSEYLSGIREALNASKSIAIIGGGMTSVELAGEIRHAHPDKPITIICAAGNLLTSSIAKPTKTFMKSLYSRLQANRINVLLGERAMKPSAKDFEHQPYLVGERVIECDGITNAKVQTDLVIWAGSWRFNNSFYPQEWLNDMGELSIRDTFQLEADDAVFAFGDISSLLETKQAITLPPKVPCIVENILAVAKAIDTKGARPDLSGLKLRRYKMTDRALIYLPVGPYDGVSISKLGFTYGGKKTSQWKGQDLFTTKFWKIFTGHDPAPLASGASTDKGSSQ